jgi:NAD(P)-dependent dehydrogenase (short-subunit alcohol dehydrogenase family)
VLSPSLPDALEGKTVMITGASSGIGRAGALKIGAAGGGCCWLPARGRSLRRSQPRSTASGGTAFVHPCDLSELEDIDRMVAEVLEQHGGVDILVNNAGRSIRRSVKRSHDRFTTLSGRCS